MNAMERVRQRLERATAALQSAGVRYAVAGGNAVAVHVARVDESLVRNTRDVAKYESVTKHGSTPLTTFGRIETERGSMRCGGM